MAFVEKGTPIHPSSLQQRWGGVQADASFGRVDSRQLRVVLVTELGFPTASVFYDRKARELGESKYSLIKMLRLAWTGITSFSDTPMKLALFLGFFICFLACMVGIFTLAEWLIGDTVSGWTSLTLLILFFSGLQMLLLGIMGEYIGKIYMQSKHRSRYIIQGIIGEKL